MKVFLFLGNLGTPEIITLALLVLFMFGGKKIPELMRGIGKGVKSFKEGIKGIENDIKSSVDDDSINSIKNDIKGIENDLKSSMNDITADIMDNTSESNS